MKRETIIRAVMLGAAGGLLFLSPGLAGEELPEIAHIHPESAGSHLGAQIPHLIVGEQLDHTDLELRVWNPPDTPEDIAAGLEEIERSGKPQDLPAAPPDGSRKVEVASVEAQSLFAQLWAAGNDPPAMVWVGAKGNFSEPVLLLAPRPLWVSRESARPGEVVSIFGFGMRPRFQTARIALFREKGPGLVLSPSRNPRGMTGEDEKMLYFAVPADAAPGEVFRVFVHNGYGGAYGWIHAGNLEVADPALKKPVFLLLDFGLKSDGLSDETAAFEAALEAIAAAGGGILQVPAGTFRVSRSLVLPENTTLQGVGESQTRIIGTPSSQSQVIRSVVLLRSRSGLENLALSGWVTIGLGGAALVGSLPDADFPGNVGLEILNCKLEGTPVDPGTGSPIYRGGQTIQFGGIQHRPRIVGNQLFGGMGLSQDRGGRMHRGEIQDNFVRGGGMVTRAIACLIEGNIFADAPARLTFYSPTRANCIRFNEMRGRFLDSWQNQPELFLFHGGRLNQTGIASVGEGDQLVDPTADWQPGTMQEQLVILIAGKGFGQYRRVVDNTKTALQLDRPWRIAPDSSSEYVVGHFLSESAIYANLTDSPGAAVTLWLDCINNRVEKHRAFGAGLIEDGSSRSGFDENGQPSNTERYHPSFYNVFSQNWLDGSYLGIRATHNETRTESGPVIFGTYFVRNQLRSPHFQRSPAYYGHQAFAGGIQLGGATIRPVVAGNFVLDSEIGVNISEDVSGGMILHNRFQGVQHPIVDRGQAMTVRENLNMARPEDLIQRNFSPRDARLFREGTWEPILPP